MSRNAKASQWVPDELIAVKRKGRPIFPFLLDDTEPFLAIEAIQGEDVMDGKLPTEKFYERLAKVTSRQKKAGRKVATVDLMEAARKKKVKANTEKITIF
jgi:hypothetical protein